MRRTCLVVLALASAAALSLAAQGRTERLVTQTWTVGGVERTALVAAPAVAAGTMGSPLVLIFHGHGGTAQHAARTFAIHAQWPEAVVIYGQGLPTPGQLTDPEGRRAGWQHAIGGQGDRDLAYVDAIVAWARSRFTIDGTRIYAGGHSNGGTMTYVLWAARGSLLAAVAPSASVFRRELLSAAKPKPALIIAGQRDQLVPFAAQKSSLQAALRLNQAAATGEPWSGAAVRHKSSIGTNVVAYIHAGDHAMPEDAGALMVKFFKEQTVVAAGARR